MSKKTGYRLCQYGNLVPRHSVHPLAPRRALHKRWLAQVGYERVKEIENTELASARARELYQAKGYPQAWIEKRLRSIAIRGELTDEWKGRGVQEG